MIEQSTIFLVPDNLQKGNIEWKMEDKSTCCLTIILVPSIAGIRKCDYITKLELTEYAKNIMMALLVIFMVKQCTC